MKVTCLQSGTVLEIKLLVKYFPIASRARTSINFVEHILVAASIYDTKQKTYIFLEEKYIWIKDYKKWTGLVNAL